MTSWTILQGPRTGRETSPPLGTATMPPANLPRYTGIEKDYFTGKAKFALNICM